MEPKESFQQFRDDNFLAHHTLNDKLVLEYFYLSQFYDSSSLNQRRRRGLQVSTNAEGTEFRLIYRNSAARGQCQIPPGSQWNYPNQFGIFVIQRFSKDSKGTETPLECYYIIGGTIYKSPLLGNLIRQRILTSTRHLEILLKNLSRISSWSLLEGYSWGSHKSDDESDEYISTTLTLDQQKQLKLEHGNDNSEECRNKKMESESREEILLSNIAPTVELSEKSDYLHKRRTRDDSDSELASRWVAVEDLYTKRQCTDASRIIEETFAALANASTRFNTTVDGIRESWQAKDQIWQQQELGAMQPSEYK